MDDHGAGKIATRFLGDVVGDGSHTIEIEVGAGQGRGECVGSSGNDRVLLIEWSFQ